MNRDHWFWKYAYENKGVYIQGGIATLMVNLFALVIGFFVMVVYDRIIPSNALTSLAGLFIGASFIIILKWPAIGFKLFLRDFLGLKIWHRFFHEKFEHWRLVVESRICVHVSVIDWDEEVLDRDSQDYV